MVKLTAQRVSGGTLESELTLMVKTSLPGMSAGSATLAESRSCPGSGSGIGGNRSPTIGIGSGKVALPAGTVSKVLPGAVQASGRPVTVTT